MKSALTLGLAALALCLTFSNKASAMAASENQVIATCLEMSFTDDKVKCAGIVNNHLFDENALSACRSLSFGSEKLNCLRAIADHRFAGEAVNVCRQLSFDSDKPRCFDTIAEKNFSTAGLSMCASMSFSSDKISCLARFGVSANTVYVPQAPVIVRPPVYVPAPVQNRAGLCIVKQTGQWMSSENFYSWVSNQARMSRQCAVGNVAFESYTNRLYTADGRRVGSSFSHKELEMVKRNTGLMGCRHYTCDLN